MQGLSEIDNLWILFRDLKATVGVFKMEKGKYKLVDKRFGTKILYSKARGKQNTIFTRWREQGGKEKGLKCALRRIAFCTFQAFRCCNHHPSHELPKAHVRKSSSSPSQRTRNGFSNHHRSVFCEQLLSLRRTTQCPVTCDTICRRNRFLVYSCLFRQRRGIGDKHRD